MEIPQYLNRLGRKVDYVPKKAYYAKTHDLLYASHTRETTQSTTENRGLLLFDVHPVTQAMWPGLPYIESRREIVIDTWQELTTPEFFFYSALYNTSNISYVTILTKLETFTHSRESAKSDYAKEYVRNAVRAIDPYDDYNFFRLLDLQIDPTLIYPRRPPQHDMSPR